MAISTEISYITYAQFKANSRIVAQQTLSDAVLKPYILHAERIIDAYVGYTERYEIDQSMKFPIKNRLGNSEFPTDVQLACIELTMWLILKGEPTLESLSDFESQEWTATGYKIKLKSNKSAQSLSLDLPYLVARLLRAWSGSNARVTFGF